MGNSLFNRFGNTGNNSIGNSGNNILSYITQVQKNPEVILDILMQNGKINQQQYNELQQFKNNPKDIVYYLLNNGNPNQKNQMQQSINQIMK